MCGLEISEVSLWLMPHMPIHAYEMTYLHSLLRYQADLPVPCKGRARTLLSEKETGRRPSNECSSTKHYKSPTFGSLEGLRR